MSRSYRIYISVEDYNRSNLNEIEEALMDQWPFQEFDYYSKRLSACQDDFLYIGETEQEAALRLTHAVWKANEACCKSIELRRI